MKQTLSLAKRKTSLAIVVAQASHPTKIGSYIFLWPIRCRWSTYNLQVGNGNAQCLLWRSEYVKY